MGKTGDRKKMDFQGKIQKSAVKTHTDGMERIFCSVYRVSIGI
jgi:hypothetical protein